MLAHGMRRPRPGTDDLADGTPQRPRPSAKTVTRRGDPPAHGSDRDRRLQPSVRRCAMAEGNSRRPFNRRGFLTVGAVGGLGLSLGDFFRLQARAELKNYAP